MVLPPAVFLIRTSGVQVISPMSRARIIGVAAALAVFVYLGATATDTRVGELIKAVQTALKTDRPMPFDLIDCFCAPSVSGPRFLEIPMAVAFVVVFFGGLPLAVFGLLIEWQWTEVEPEPCWLVVSS